MTGFNTKLDLDNSKVYQVDGQLLTLSGNTVIASVGNIKYATHPTFTGGTQLVDKIYVDMAASGATGNTVYKLQSPAAITVGGICAGDVLTGKTSNQILEELLVPTLYPTLTAPSSSIGINPSGTFEVGCSISTLCLTTTFSQGSISPAYCGGPSVRSGPANHYCYTGSQVAGCYTCVTSPVTKCATSYVISAGTASWGSCVLYDAGQQPKDSKGFNYCAPLGAGNTAQQTASLTGIYPYFYGKCTCPGSPGASRPTATSAMVSGGTKVVATSASALSINFSSTADDYLWFAYPNTNAAKICWCVTALNNGAIGGGVSAGCNLFPANDTVSVTTVCWSGVSYKVYISNYQTAVSAAMSLS